MDRKRNKNAEAEIDRLMRQVFDELAAKPVPERFNKLLERLKACEESEVGSAKNSGDSGNDPD